MKIYHAALALALFLSCCSFDRSASASTAPAAFAPEANLSSSCSAGGPTLDLSQFTPKPSPMYDPFPQCGACSLSPCKFAAQGTNCGPIIDGAWGHCWDVYGTTTCTQDGLPKCQCWRGDLP